MKILSTLVFLLVIFNGCSKELNINLNEPEKKIVLYPFLSNDKAIVIKMSAPTGVTSNSFPKLANAFVVITENNVPVDTVTINAKGKGISKVTSKPNRMYGFNAFADDYPKATCYAQLPSKPEIISMDTSYFLKNGSSLIKIRLRIKDDPTSTNYYKVNIINKALRISTKFRGTPANYERYDSVYFSNWNSDFDSNSTTLEFFFTRGNQSFILAKEKELFADGGTYSTQYGSDTYYYGNESYYSDVLSGGNEFTINIILNLFSGGASFTTNDKYLIEVTSIGADYYNGVKSYANYGTVRSANLPFSEEVSIYSAVQGGHGFPLAYYTVIDSSIVGTLKPQNN